MSTPNGGSKWGSSPLERGPVASVTVDVLGAGTLNDAGAGEAVAPKHRSKSTKKKNLLVAPAEASTGVQLASTRASFPTGPLLLPPSGGAIAGDSGFTRVSITSTTTTSTTGKKPRKHKNAVGEGTSESTAQLAPAPSASTGLIEKPRGRPKKSSIATSEGASNPGPRPVLSNSTMSELPGPPSNLRGGPQRTAVEGQDPVKMELFTLPPMDEDGGSASTSTAAPPTAPPTVSLSVTKRGSKKSASGLANQTWKVAATKSSSLRPAGARDTVGNLSSGGPTDGKSAKVQIEIRRPRIWTSDKAELIAALPSLGPSRCTNGVSWTHTKAPMVLLDDQVAGKGVRSVDMVPVSLGVGAGAGADGGGTAESESGDGGGGDEGTEPRGIRTFDLFLTRTLVPAGTSTKANTAPTFGPLTTGPSTSSTAPGGTAAATTTVSTSTHDTYPDLSDRLDAASTLRSGGLAHSSSGSMNTKSGKKTVHFAIDTTSIRASTVLSPGPMETSIGALDGTGLGPSTILSPSPNSNSSSKPPASCPPEHSFLTSRESYEGLLRIAEGVRDPVERMREVMQDLERAAEAVFEVREDVDVDESGGEGERMEGSEDLDVDMDVDADVDGERAPGGELGAIVDSESTSAPTNVSPPITPTKTNTTGTQATATPTSSSPKSKFYRSCGLCHKFWVSPRCFEHSVPQVTPAHELGFGRLGDGDNQGGRRRLRSGSSASASALLQKTSDPIVQVQVKVEQEEGGAGLGIPLVLTDKSRKKRKKKRKKANKNEVKVVAADGEGATTIDTSRPSALPISLPDSNTCKCSKRWVYSQCEIHASAVNFSTSTSYTLQMDATQDDSVESTSPGRPKRKAGVQTEMRIQEQSKKRKRTVKVKAGDGGAGIAVKVEPPAEDAIEAAAVGESESISAAHRAGGVAKVKVAKQSKKKKTAKIVKEEELQECIGTNVPEQQEEIVGTRTSRKKKRKRWGGVADEAQMEESSHRRKKRRRKGELGEEMDADFETPVGLEVPSPSHPQKETSPTAVEPPPVPSDPHPPELPPPELPTPPEASTTRDVPIELPMQAQESPTDPKAPGSDQPILSDPLVKTEDTQTTTMTATTTTTTNGVGPNTTALCLTSLPSEIRALIETFISGAPLVIMASRSRILEMFNNAATVTCSARFNVPLECGFTCMGFFRIVGIEEANVPLIAPLKNVASSVLCVQWRFRVEWVMGGEDAIMKHSKADLSRPWWISPLPAPEDILMDSSPLSLQDRKGKSAIKGEGVLDAIPSDSQLAVAASAVKLLEGAGDIDTPTLYLELRRAHPSYRQRDALIANYFSLVPQSLLTEFNSFISNEAFPSGWFCEACGKINFQAAMRHRKCTSAQCLKKGKQALSYAQALADIRGPHSTSPCCLPFNDYPHMTVLGTSTTWNNGMRTLSYYFDKESPAGERKIWIKHVFTCNLAHLQKRASEMVMVMQSEVEMKRPVGDPSSSFFMCTHDMASPIPGLSVPGESVPACLGGVAQFITDRTSAYAEVPKTKLDISRLKVMAWLTSGTKKNQDVLRAKNKIISVLCLGCDIVMSLTPEKKAVDGAALTKVPRKPSRKGKEVERQADMDFLIPLDGEIAPKQELSLTIAPVASSSRSPAVTSTPSLDTRLPPEGTVQIAMVHGDVLVVSGEDFGYSLKRSGTGILIFGIKAT